MNERWILIDQETGLHVGWYFWLRVLDEVNRCARYGTPFGLVLLQADVTHASPRRTLDEALAAVPGAIRSTDLSGGIGPGRVGVLLTHQEPEPAKAAVERILGRLEGSRKSGVEWSARLLCYPQDGAEISNLLTTGGSEHREGDLRLDVELPA
ncbi:MAG TPA: GGDEF domain-containing protein [Dehalococcoidia bacterium]|jgi:GGDEF domain-containing protein